MMHMSLPGLETEITTIAIGLVILGFLVIGAAVALFVITRRLVAWLSQ